MEMRNMLSGPRGKAISPREMRPPPLRTERAVGLQFQNQRAGGAMPGQARGPDCCPRVSGSGGPCPSGTGGQSFQSKKIILDPECSGLAWGLSFLPSLLFLHFGMEGSALCLSHPCILQARNLFDFIGSRLERNLP